MILPFAINSTAVFIFRQFFLQLPEDLFDAARIDGASELRILWSIALPLVRPALLTAVLLTFIGPWNEFLWPFLITKDSRPAAARGLAGQLHQQRRRPGRQPVRRDPRRRRACWLRPPWSLFLVFQRHFTVIRPRVRREGLTVTTRQHRRPVHADPARRRDDAGAGQPATRRRACSTRRAAARRTAGCTCCPRLVAAGNVSRVGLAEVDARRRRTGRRRATRRRPRPRRGLGARRRTTPASRTRAPPGCRASACT